MGGLVGRLESGTIHYSSVKGKINGSDFVGGLIGKMLSSTIQNSFANTKLTGTSNLGGLVGEQNQNGTVKNSYATTISLTANIGLVGARGTSGVLYTIDSYYDNSSHTSPSSWGEGRNTSQLKKTLIDNGSVGNVQTYNGWDFQNIWNAGNDCEYPNLRWKNSNHRPCIKLSKNSANVSETGSIDNFTVVLTTQPSSDVVFKITSDNPSEVTVSPDNLTFSNSNWNIEKTVSLIGMDDNASDGNTSTRILVEVDNLSSSIQIFGSANAEV